MNTQTATVESAQNKGEQAHASEQPRHSRRASGRRGLGLVKFLVFALVLGGSAGGAYAYLGKEKATEKFYDVVHYVKGHVIGGTKPAPSPESASDKPKGPWDGLVQVTEADRQTIGFKLIPVLPQTLPIRLELPGTTDYDLNTLVKIRPRFDNALVEKVFVSIGQTIKKGDPLFEIRSTELAQAKTDCQSKYVQWDHDHKYLVAREPLAKEGRITQIIWTDTQNDEKRSRLDYLVSRDKLATYGMTSEQIDKLLEGLRDDIKKAEVDDNTQDKSRMTILSPIDGVVVERDVVPGNFYDQTNMLLTLSPMDKIWVRGNVFESDQEKVHIGQRWDIMFQYTNETFEAKVEQIDNGVDPETRTLQIRASIPNPAKNLKARMLVRATLQIDPLKGDTVIPRNALSVINGEYYAFVQKGREGKDANLFERRKLEIEQENSDQVVVKKGLTEGETVVSNGSLILSQMYEDLCTVDTGQPVR